MDFFWQVADYMTIWCIWWNKTRFLPICDCVGTSVGMHHLYITKHTGKKLNGNYTRTLSAVFEKIQEAAYHKTAAEQPLPSHLTNHSRRSRLAENYRRSQDQFISDVLLWTPTHGQTSVIRSERTYTYQLSADTGCSLEEWWTIGKMERERERERERESVISAHLNDDIYTYIYKGKWSFI